MLSRGVLRLFVFIDALGWNIAESNGFMSEVLTHRRQLETVLGYSCSCDPTILTGLMPQAHGHFAFFKYDRERSPFKALRALELLPKSVGKRGRIRHLLSRAIAWHLGYTGYFQIYNVPFRHLPLFDYSEKRDLYVQGGILSGAPTVFDHLRTAGCRFHVSDWRLDDAAKLASARDALCCGSVEFAYLILGGLDAVLHTYGPHSPEGQLKLRTYEKALTGLLREAEGAYDEVEVHVFSDHGMTRIEQTWDLMSQINRLGLAFGHDYVAVYDSTMARFWFLRDRAKEVITAALRTMPQGMILSDRQLLEYGCLFEDRRYGELIFLLDPGTLILPSHMGETPLAGMHGYAPEHPASAAALLSNQFPAGDPCRLDDLLYLMTAGIQGNRGYSVREAAALQALQ